MREFEPFEPIRPRCGRVVPNPRELQCTPSRLARACRAAARLVVPMKSGRIEDGGDPAAACNEAAGLILGNDGQVAAQVFVRVVACKRVAGELVYQVLP